MRNLVLATYFTTMKAAAVKGCDAIYLEDRVDMYATSALSALEFARMSFAQQALQAPT